MPETADAVIESVDRQLSAAGLRTYSELVDQLTSLAAAAVRDNAALEAEVHRLEKQLANQSSSGVPARLDRPAITLDKMYTTRV